MQINCNKKYLRMTDDGIYEWQGGLLQRCIFDNRLLQNEDRKKIRKAFGRDEVWLLQEIDYLK